MSFNAPHSAFETHKGEDLKEFNNKYEALYQRIKRLSQMLDLAVLSRNVIDAIFAQIEAERRNSKHSREVLVNAVNRAREIWYSLHAQDERAPLHPPARSPNFYRLLHEHSVVVKSRYRALSRARLHNYLTNGKLNFPEYSMINVSIILVVHNQVDLTLQCLNAILRANIKDYEVIVWNNASTDETVQVLDRSSFVRVFHCKQNLHFLKAVNECLKHARGKYVLLLNNDCIIYPDAVSILEGILNVEPSVDAAGGMLLQMDGLLQEAGAIVWKDGYTEPYGGGERPSPRHQFRRDVDYCSGAFLMIRKSTFDRIGGFDSIFAPAYYEETDVCTSIWESGQRVVYESRAKALHYGYGSATDATAAEFLYRRNHDRYVQKHKAQLEQNHLVRGAGPTKGRTHGSIGTAFFIDLSSDLSDFNTHVSHASASVLLAMGFDVTYCAPLIDRGDSFFSSAIWRRIECLPGSFSELSLFIENKETVNYDIIFIGGSYRDVSSNIARIMKEMLASERIIDLRQLYG